MKKLGTLFTLLCIMNLFALTGLVGYLFATGRLDGHKVSAIVAMVRHQGTPDKFNEQLYDILEPAPATNPATAPASQPALASDNRDATLGSSAQDRLDIARMAMEQERIRLESAAQELRHQHELLVQLQSDVQDKYKKIESERKSFQEQLAAADTKAKNDSFQKSLDLYSELKPKQVKDLFLGLTPDLVATYLLAMDSSQAGKIISEFKSTDESKFISTVLDRIRDSGTSSALGSPATGDATAAAAPGT